MLAAWDQRSQQLRCLFNPAFSASLMCVAVRAYDCELPDGSGLPLIVSYLLLPLALHVDTRNVLPSTTRTSLTHWINQHPEIHIGLADRVAAFREITSEGIRYAIAGGIVRLSDAGGLVHVPLKPRGLSAVKDASEEVSQCFKAATDLGRWFARVPDSEFLFRTLRIRP
jgi:hypothetical protein